MYVDAITVAALLAEFNEQLVGGRVQDVVQVDELAIGLEIYARRQRRYLLVSAQPESARCHLMTEKLRRGVMTPSPLWLLLKKYVEGARLEAVNQPPWERILQFDFSGPNGETRLIAEIMDQRSNIILTVEGEILDCAKRIGPEQSRYRVLLPGRPYQPPPPQEKILPEAIMPAQLKAILSAASDIPAWRALVNEIAGVSPLFAREVIYRASGDTEAPAFDVAGELIHAALMQMVSDVRFGRWSPCVVSRKAGGGKAAFAAYALTHLKDWSPTDSISAAMEVYFGEVVGDGPYEAAKAQLRSEIEEAMKRARRKQESLERQSVSGRDIELLRKKGELIYAYAATIRPGQTELRAQYEPDGPTLIIELDPTLSPTKNAQAYFGRYEKAKRAAADLPSLQQSVRYDLAYLEQLATDLDLAENWPDIEAVREALQGTSYWKGSKKHGLRGGKSGIRRFTTGDGFVILVGRNAAQNHQLMTERSTGDDLWLHARQRPGSHVIIKNDGRPIPDEVIRYAAELAAYYSAGRGETTVEVDVTERRYVRPIKGAQPGLVTYRNERTLAVRPIPEQ